MSSEFGKGLSYCLGLFLAHAERWLPKSGNEEDWKSWANTWFNASSDHLYELQIPENLSKNLQNRLRKFQKKCLDLGHGSGLLSGNITKEDCFWAIHEAKDLLRLIDKANGIKVQKGDWE